MRQPDQEGPAGKAWLYQPQSPAPEYAASLGTWLVNVPSANQHWEWWVVAVVHLREGPSLPPAKLIYDQAAYEFNILTVDPEEYPIDPEVAEVEGVSFLYPPDVVEQFDGVQDADAALIAAMTVTSIVKGEISPDADFRPKWKTLLSDTVASFQQKLHVFN